VLHYNTIARDPARRVKISILQAKDNRRTVVGRRVREDGEEEKVIWAKKI